MAAVITVHEGEQIQEANIRVAPQFAARHLTVRVTWSDGRLVKDWVHIDAKETAARNAIHHTHQPDPKASVLELSILPNEAYEIEAQLICQYAGENSVGPGATLKSNNVYLGARDDRTEVWLRLPGTACPEVAGKKLLSERQ